MLFNDYNLIINKCCIQNPVKHLRWSYLRKYLIAESRELFQQKVPSSMFNQVLNTPGEIFFKVIILKVFSSTAKTSRKTMLFNQTPKLNISSAMFVFQQTNLSDTGVAHIKSLASHVVFVQLQPVAIISRRTVMITYFRKKIN